MALRTELHLGRAHFQREWQRTKSEVKRGALEMRRDTEGIGDSLAAGLKGGLGKIAAIGGVAFGLTETAQGIRLAATEAQRLVNMADGLNEPIESLVRLRHAAKTMGMDFETVSELSRELEDRLGDLGNSEPVEVMDRLGLSIEGLMGMPIDQKLVALAEAFEKGRVDGVAYSDMLKLLGDSVGEQLLPLLGQGKEAIEEMFDGAADGVAAEIQRLAELNERLNEVGASASDFRTKYLGSIVGVGDFLKDLFDEDLNVSAALERAAERSNEFARRQAENDREREDTAAAIARRREEEEGESAEAKAVAAVAAQLERIQKIRDAIGDREIVKLPAPERIEALQARIAEIAQRQVGEDSIFEPSREGLQSFADSLEVKLNRYGGDRGPLIEALEALDEIREKEEEIADIRRKAAEEELAREKERLDNLAASREDAEEGRVALLSPEEQFREMRRQLEESLGIEIEGGQSLERGLQNLRAEVQRARESGDQVAEQAALDRLNQAQEDAREFVDAAERFRETTEAPVPTGPVGAVQGLVNQIFGRDPQQQQLDELRRTREEIAGSNDILADILLKMDDPPRPDTFDDFGLR